MKDVDNKEENFQIKIKYILRKIALSSLKRSYDNLFNEIIDNLKYYDEVEIQFLNDTYKLLIEDLKSNLYNLQYTVSESDYKVSKYTKNNKSVIIYYYEEDDEK